MSSAPAVRCPAFLREYPGAVLEVSAGGTVLESNGRLDAALSQPLAGRPFASVLDRASSRAKWERMLHAADAQTGVWELVLQQQGKLTEPRAFSLVRDPDADSLWLIEHPRDHRLTRLAEEVTGINSELSRTQRALSKEKIRLNAALAELEDRQRELEHRNSELDQFAHVVSHDLKAPLRSIASYALWLEEELGGAASAEARQYLNRVRDRAQHMAGMIQGILDYARAGREEQEPEPVDTGALVAEMLSWLCTDEEWVVEVQPELPTLFTTRIHFEQVLLNLVSNAFRYGRPPHGTPRLCIGAREAGDLYEFSVADNGPGIPERLRERVWTLFFSAQPAAGADSSGVGLAVVKKLVETHGGTVWMQSELDQGTTFFFTWPKHPHAA